MLAKLFLNIFLDIQNTGRPDDNQPKHDSTTEVGHSGIRHVVINILHNITNSNSCVLIKLE